MDIVTVEKHMAFAINYTKEERDMVYALWPGGWNCFIAMSVPDDQALAYAFDDLRKSDQKKFKVRYITMDYDEYQREIWKYYCKKGLFPRIRYEEKGERFMPLEDSSDKWKSVNVQMPENEPECHARENDISSHVLVALKDGRIETDCRVKTEDGGWIWYRHVKDDIVAWMMILDCPFITSAGKK